LYGTYARRHLHRLTDATASWFEHACDYVDMKWPRAAAKSRKLMAEALTTATMAMLADKRNRPNDELLRQALYGWAFNAPEQAAGEPPRDIASAITWIQRASRPVSAMRDLTLVRRVLDALALKLDGKPAAATTVARKRARSTTRSDTRSSGICCRRIQSIECSGLRRK
jgi:hypothetical protein